MSEERTSEDKAKAKGFFGRLFRKGKPETAPEPPPGAEPGSEDRKAAAPEAEPVVPVDSPAEVEEEPGGGEAGAEVAPEVPGPEASSRAGLFARLRSGLSKTRDGFVRKVDRALFGRKEIDAETLEALEEVLITADLGVHTVEALIGEIQERVSRKELTSPEALREHLKEAIREILVADEGHLELGPERPYVLMVVGVNGVGKTTTIGKIAAQFRARGHKVVLAAADTFRAAAIEQLAIWGDRVGATVVRHQHGSDPAAVAFDAVEAARARKADLVIVDTAGRLHTKTNLMEELKKVRRVLDKALPGAPHEVLLVLDATTGQNAVSQARTFRDATGVNSIALTKLDGTAKGGVIVAICHELGIPVKYIGIGEGVEDLRPFDARAFVDALF